MAAPRFADSGLELEEARPARDSARSKRLRSRFGPSARAFGPRLAADLTPVAVPDEPDRYPAARGEVAVLCAVLHQALADLAARRPTGKGYARQAARAWRRDRDSAQRFLAEDSATLDLCLLAAGLDGVALREALAKRVPEVHGLARTRAGRR